MQTEPAFFSEIRVFEWPVASGLQIPPQFAGFYRP